MTTIEMIMAGIPTLKKYTKVMWCPSAAALPAITMLALAPMRVPLPPKQAPKARAHASGSIAMPGTSAASCLRMGTMVAVKGMLSTNALKKALLQRMRPMAKYWREAMGASAIMPPSVDATKRSSPSSPSPSTITNSAAKKSSVSHSTPCRASWQWCMSKATSSQTAPRIATHAGSKCVTGWRKKEEMTHASTAPHLTSSAGSVMG
mmetsp:Transcript_8380/g.17974  ORF Transcript_8380/g.17974 Transcript_8380/m.17974 type:complete len:206 (+) Transcript_8380:75-692(+)